MDIQSYLKSLKKEVKVIDALLEYTAIAPLADYPFQDYIGINFTESGINSFKFYFAVFQPISKEFSSKFLDHPIELT